MLRESLQLSEAAMPHEELIALLHHARSVLKRYMFEGETIRDDVAEVCMAIDDALPDETRVAVRRGAELERSAA
jgi:hypothetical protein